jgi:hypothetical protein
MNIFNGDGLICFVASLGDILTSFDLLEKQSHQIKD